MILTWDLLNTKQKCYFCAQNAKKFNDYDYGGGACGGGGDNDDNDNYHYDVQ
jgi:hypothetical protein